jgi:hypothetical protein
MIQPGNPMRRRVLPLLALSLCLGACFRSEPPPAAPPPPPPPQSSWRADDSQAVAKELVDSALKHPWLVNFRTRANRAPALAIGEITDNSGDHVDTATLGSDMEKLFADSQQVAISDEPAKADVVLSGTITREAIPGGSRFTIDVHLAGHDGEAVWVGGLEREVARAAEAPASPAPTQPSEGK